MATTDLFAGYQLLLPLHSQELLLLLHELHLLLLLLLLLQGLGLGLSLSLDLGRLAAQVGRVAMVTGHGVTPLLAGHGVAGAGDVRR